MTWNLSAVLSSSRVWGCKVHNSSAESSMWSLITCSILHVYIQSSTTNLAAKSKSSVPGLMGLTAHLQIHYFMTWTQVCACLSRLCRTTLVGLQIEPTVFWQSLSGVGMFSGARRAQSRSQSSRWRNIGAGSFLDSTVLSIQTLNEDSTAVPRVRCHHAMVNCYLTYHRLPKRNVNRIHQNLIPSYNSPVFFLELVLDILIHTQELKSCLPPMSDSSKIWDATLIEKFHNLHLS